MQFDDKLINSANKTIEKIYEKILKDIENGPNIIYKEFEKEFIFENFFTKYLRFATFKNDSIKMRLCEDICYTIVGNCGDVSIVELAEMFTNLKQTKKFEFSKDNIIPVEFDISLNGEIVTVTDTMSADEIYNVIHDSNKE